MKEKTTCSEGTGGHTQLGNRGGEPPGKREGLGERDGVG